MDLSKIQLDNGITFDEKGIPVMKFQGNHTIDNFIGVFEQAVSKEYCEEVIKHFNWLSKVNKTTTRLNHEGAVEISKQGELAYIRDHSSDFLVETNGTIASVFNDSVWKCYELYMDKYPALKRLREQKVYNYTQLQKVRKTEGYHTWHCEHAGIDSGDRVLAVLLYLNDINDGGETEFLYQSLRIKPKQGTLLIFPAAFTHTHRGNPPLNEDKYLMASWINFVR